VLVCFILGYFEVAEQHCITFAELMHHFFWKFKLTDKTTALATLSCPASYVYVTVPSVQWSSYVDVAKFVAIIAL